MRFNLTILGSNSALPAHGRFPSAQILDVEDQLFLFDCGEGAQIQMNRYGIRRNRIERIFISHMHGDHIFGLAGLITSYNHYSRRKPLTVYGPKGLEEAITTQLKFTGTPLSYRLIFEVVDPEKSAVVFESEHYKVTNFPLVHRIPTTGYRFEIKEGMPHLDPEKLEYYKVPFDKREEIRKGADFTDPEGKTVPGSEFILPPAPAVCFAYVTDTVFDERIVPHIEGVDLLYHEATFRDNLRDKAERTRHSTARQAGEIAKKAGAKRLIIGHFSSRYRDLTPLLEEAREAFPETELALEGKTFTVE